MASEGHTRKYYLSTTLKPLVLLDFSKSYNFTPTKEEDPQKRVLFFGSARQREPAGAGRERPEASGKSRGTRGTRGRLGQYPSLVTPADKTCAFT